MQRLFPERPEPRNLLTRGEGRLSPHSQVNFGTGSSDTGSFLCIMAVEDVEG